MSHEQKEVVKSIMSSFCSRRKGTYCQTIFDTTQTHAIYGITDENKDSIRLDLAQLGAKKFRTVKANGKGLYIVCFDASNIK